MNDVPNQAADNQRVELPQSSAPTTSNQPQLAETQQFAPSKQPDTKRLGSSTVTWLLIVAALIVIVVMLFGGGGYGDPITQNYTTDTFTRVHLASGVGQLQITPADEAGLEIEAPEKYLQWVTVTTEDGQLTIDVDRPWFQQIFFVGPNDDDIVYKLNITQLTELTVDGVIDADTTETLILDELAVLLNGAADIDLDIAVNAFSFELNGAGSATVQGTADTQSIVINGAGDFDGSELVGATVTVGIEGAGDADVHATETLEARIDGAGSIDYYGDPENVTEELNGVGSIGPASENDTAELEDSEGESEEYEGEENDNANSEEDSTEDSDTVDEA